MGGTSSAPWFVEVDGQKQGPYSSQQIVKLVMDGALKLESRIYDEAAGTWKIAADVIPYLDLDSSSKKNPNETGWQPPTRPTELRDVHVVDVNDNAGEVDYYALISDRQRNQERPVSTSGRASNLNERSSQQQAPGPAAKPMPPTKPRKTAPKPTSPDGLLIAQTDSAPAQLEEGVSKFVQYSQGTIAFARQNKSTLSIAAALALVFLGTYGVIKSLSHRDLATKDTDQDGNSARHSRRLEANIAPRASSAPSSDELGTGRNHVHRNAGGVASQGVKSGFPQIVAAPVVSPPQNNGQEPPRDPPVYYSSGNDPELQSPQPVIPPNGADPSPNYVNPVINNAVQVPGFIPPQQAPNTQTAVDPNDPNRYPTADPNAPQPSQQPYTQ